MARKQITQFTAAASVALTDYLLLQPGATGTDYVYAPVSMILQGSLAGTYSTITVNGSSVPANGMYLPATNTLGWSVNTTAEMQMTGTALSPATSDGLALGTTALMWSDAFLASGAVLNFNNGDVTVAHSADTLTVAGGQLSLTGTGTGLAVTNNVTIGGTVTTTGSETAAAFIPVSATIPTNGMYLPAGNTLGWSVNSAAEVQLTSTALSPAVSDGSALGTSSLMWGDLFLASGGVINFNNGDVTLTHAADTLTIAGGNVNIGAVPGSSSTLHVYAALSPVVTIDSPVGQNRAFHFKTGNSLRWSFFANSTAESGSNVGSDLSLNYYSDAGAYVGTAFTIARANGNVGIGTTADSGVKLHVSGNVKATGYFLRSVGNALTATGTTRADALQLANEVNRLTTVAAGTGAILPVGVVGMRIRIYQSGANPVKVYASASETIDGVAGATGVTLTNALRCEYEFVAANTWISAQLGVVSA